eukprot:gene4617-7373_t
MPPKLTGQKKAMVRVPGQPVNEPIGMQREEGARLSTNPLVHPAHAAARSDAASEEQLNRTDECGRQPAQAGIFSFNPEDLHRIQTTFFELSAGDDWLSYTKTKDLWAVVFPGVPASEVGFLAEKIFTDLDSDNSGTVSWVELEVYLRSGGPKTGDAELDFKMPRPQTWRGWMWAVLEQPYSENFELKALQRISWIWTIFIQMVTVASITNMIN